LVLKLETLNADNHELVILASMVFIWLDLALLFRLGLCRAAGGTMAKPGIAV
jgi:hypothetical protein